MQSPGGKRAGLGAGAGALVPVTHSAIVPVGGSAQLSEAEYEKRLKDVSAGAGGGRNSRRVAPRAAAGLRPVRRVMRPRRYTGGATQKDGARRASGGPSRVSSA